MARIRKLQPGDAAPDGMAWAADGRELSLATCWVGGPVLLTFLRHFG